MEKKNVSVELRRNVLKQNSDFFFFGSVSFYFYFILYLVLYRRYIFSFLFRLNIDPLIVFIHLYKQIYLNFPLYLFIF